MRSLTIMPILLLATTLPARAQFQQPPAPQAPAQAPVQAPAQAPAPKSALTLPAPQTVDAKAGRLLTVEAKGAKEVSWEVFLTPDSESVDWFTKDNSLVLPVPAPGVTVYIVAAAVVDGKVVTARTSITVKGEAPRVGAAPGTAPATPAKSGKVRHATILYDGKNVTAETKALLGFDKDAPSLQKAAADRSVKLRVLDIRDAEVKALGFDKLYQSAGGVCIALQGEDGNLIPANQVVRLAPSGDVGKDIESFVQLIEEANK